MFDPGTHFLSGLMALGIAWAFIRADPDSATSRALSLALAFTGLSIFARLIVLELIASGEVPWWTGWLACIGSIAFLAAFEWTSRVRQTIPAGELRTKFGDRSLRIAQGLVVIYTGAAIADPHAWALEFLPGPEGSVAWSGKVIWLFALPVFVSVALWVGSMLLCLNRRPDPAERVRIVAVLVAGPLVAAGLVLPLAWTPVVTTLGFIVLIVGALRHAQLHGRRGLFMSRFLSPQVANLVNRAGLRAAMQVDRQEISVVCCDLRGFTAYARTNDSSNVLHLLNEYYDIVGNAVVEVEGTIKDYAGDGVLILIGAPVAFEDHAARALVLAERIQADVSAAIAGWLQPGFSLGVGVGVASGEVTVGVIGGEGRLEYAAVGSAVNMAARLCDRAGDGEIYVAAETVARATHIQSNRSFQRNGPLDLKGFPPDVETFRFDQRIAVPT